MIENIKERIQQLAEELDKEKVFEEMLEKIKIGDRINELALKIKYEIIKWEVEPTVNQIKALQEDFNKHRQDLDDLPKRPFWKRIIEKRLNRKVIQWHREEIKKIKEKIQEYLKKIEVIEFIIKAHLAERCWKCGEVFISLYPNDPDGCNFCEKCGAYNPKLKMMDEDRPDAELQKAQDREIAQDKVSDDKVVKFRVREGVCFYGIDAEHDHFSIKTLWEGDDRSEFPFKEYTGGETIDHETGKIKTRTIPWAKEPFEFYGGHTDFEVLIWTEKEVNGEWVYYRLPEYYVLVADTYYEKFARQEIKEPKAV